MSNVRAVPFTKASLRRAADVAREKGLELVVRPDGSLVLKAPSYPQQSQPDTIECGREILL
jgi:prophage tail gpP-like protein